MKNLLFLYCAVVVFVFSTQTFAALRPNRWNSLAQADNKSVKVASESCQKVLEYAENRSKLVIEKIINSVQKTSKYSNIPPRIKKTVTETSRILKRVSTKIAIQIDDLGDQFLKRLQTIIYSAKRSSESIARELQSIYDSRFDQATELAIQIEELFNGDYNPTSVLQQAVLNSLNSKGNDDKMKEVAISELHKLSQIIETEIDKLQDVSVELIDKWKAGLFILKDLYDNFKRSKGYPSSWHNMRETIKECVHLAKILSPDRTADKSTEKEDEIDQPDEVVDADGVEPDFEVESPLPYNDKSSEEESELQLNEEDNNEYTKIFLSTKKKLVKKLINNIMQLKSLKDAKKLDSRVHTTLEEYKNIFNRLNYKTNNKIIDVGRQFIKLYKVIMTIVGRLNPGMRANMNVIYENREIQIANENEANIIRYFSQVYFTEAKVTELYEQISSNIRSTKSKAEVQNRIIKELSSITNELATDIEDMEKAMAYMLNEIQKGIFALQTIKNECNITGWRYYFNNFKGDEELSQLRTMINIINMLNMDESFEREQINTISAHARNMLKKIRAQVQYESEKFAAEITEASGHDIRDIITSNVNEYNAIVQKYSTDMRKRVKRSVTIYLSIYEEILTIIRRKKSDYSQLLEELQFSYDSTSYDDIIMKYLLEGTLIDVEEYTYIHFSRDASENEIPSILQDIYRLTEAINNEITTIDQTTVDIVNMIRAETETLENIKIRLEYSESFELSEMQIQAMRNIMQVINSLQMNVENPDSINSCLEEAKEQVDSIAAIAEEELKDLNTKSQVQTQIEITSTDLREIVSSTHNEIYENLKKSVRIYTDTLDHFLQTRSDLEAQISDYQLDETLNSDTGDYIKGNHLTNDLITIESSDNTDIETLKSKFLQSLHAAKAKLDTELEDVKRDITKIIEKLDHGIDTIHRFESGHHNEITVETLQILKIANYWSHILKEIFAEETVSEIDEMYSAIKETRQAIISESDKAVQSISTYENAEKIFSKSVDVIESMYQSLTNNIQNKVEEQLLEFISSYEAKVNLQYEQQTKEVNEVLQSITEAYNQFSTESDIEYQTFLQFINTNGVTIRDLYEQIQETAADSKIRLLADQVNERITKMEEIVQYVMNNLQTSLDILQNDLTSFTTTQIKELVKMQYTAQAVRAKLENASIIDFLGTHSKINSELQRVIDKIEHITDTDIQQEIMISLENVSSSYNSIRETVSETIKQDLNSFNELYQQSKLDLKDITFTEDTEYKKFHLFINSDSYQTSTAVQKLYKNFQMSENLTIETGTQQMRSLNNEINQQLDDMQLISNYVTSNLKKGTQILEKTQLKSINIDQLKQLKKCINIIEAINKNTTIKIADFITAKNQIEEKCATTIKTIEALDESTILQDVNETVKNISYIYNNIQQEVDIKIKEHSTTFEQIYQKLITENHHISSTLQEIINGKYNFETDEKFVEFKTFFDNKFYQSSSTVQNIFNSIHSSHSSETVYQRSVIELRELSAKVTNQFGIMQDVSEYVISVLTKGTDILKQINSAELKDEEIKHFVTCVQIQQTLSKTISSNSSSSLVSERSLISSDHSVDIDFSNAIQKFIEYASTTQHTIETLQDEQSIQQEITKSVQYYEDTFSSMQQITAEKIHLSATNFQDYYNKLMNTNTDNKSHISTILQSIVNSNITIEKNEQITQLVQHDNKNFVHQLYDNIHQSETNTDIKQKSIYEMKSLSDQITKQVEQMKDVAANVMENIKKGMDILQTLEADNNQGLTQEQLTQLTTSIQTARSITVNETVNENNSLLDSILSYTSKNKKTEKTESSIAESITENSSLSESTLSHTARSTDAEKIDFITGKININDEYLNTVTHIETLHDEWEIKDATATSVQKYEEIYNTVREQVNQQVHKYASNFMSNYQQINSEIIQSYLQQTDIHIETDIEFQQVVSHISYYNVSSTVTEFYKNIHNTQDNITDLTKQSIHELELLKTKVDEHFDLMDKTTNYIITNLKHGYEILNTIQNSQVTSEKVTELIKSIRIAETINNFANTKQKANFDDNIASQQQYDFYSDLTVFQNEINSEHENTVKSLKTLQDKESIKQAVSNSAHNYNNIYTKVIKNIKIRIEESSFSFMKSYYNTDKNTTLQNTVTLNSQYSLDTDNEYQKFVSSLSSSTIMQELLDKFESNEDSSSEEDYNQKYIRCIDSFTTQVNSRITELEKTLKHISETLKAGSDILHLLETKTELTTEQTEQLQKSILIAQNIKNNITLRDISTAIDINIAHEEINNEYESAIKSIETLQDEQNIKQVINSNVEKYDTVCAKINHNVKTKFDRVTNEFLHTYHEVENKISQNNLEQVKQDLEIDEEYQKFVSTVTSESFKSSSVIKYFYENLQKTEVATENYSHTNEMLELKNETDKYIDNLDRTTKYVLDNLQNALEIMESVSTETTELNEEKIKQITKSVQIVEILKIHSSSAVVHHQSSDIIQDTVNTEQKEIDVSDTSSDEEQTILNVVKNTVQKLIVVEDENATTDSISTVKNVNVQANVATKIIPDTNTNMSHEDVITNTPSVQENIDNSITNIVQTHTSTETEIFSALDNESSTNIRSIDNTTNENVKQNIETDTTNIITETKLHEDVIKNKQSASENTDTSITDTIQTHTPTETEIIPVSNSESLTNVRSIDNTISENLQQNTETTITNKVISDIKTNTETNIPAETDLLNNQYITEASSTQSQQNTNIVEKTSEITTVESTTQKTDILSNFLSSLSIADTSNSSSEENDLREVPSIQPADMKSCIPNASELKVSLKSKNKQTYEIFSLNEFLVQKETTDIIWLRKCQSLNWDSELLYEQDKLVIAEIKDLIIAAKESIRQVIETNKIKLKLYRDIEDSLVLAVITTERINEILQQFSYIMDEQIRIISSTLIKTMYEYSNTDWQNETPIFDEQLIQIVKSFIALSYNSKTNLINIVDEQFTANQCSSYETSKIVVIEKLEKLQLFANIIFDNVDCILLNIVDIIMNAKISLEKLKVQSNIEDIRILHQNIKIGENLSNILINYKES